MNISADKNEYKLALAKAHKDEEAHRLIETLIDDHFTMLAHLKTTSLYDVLEYEKRLTNGVIGPLEILTYENETLKKEVNKLRRQLGKIEKYKEQLQNERNPIQR
mgnify:CR=1 FL=1